MTLSKPHCRSCTEGRMRLCEHATYSHWVCDNCGSVTYDFWSPFVGPDHDDWATDYDHMSRRPSHLKEAIKSEHSPAPVSRSDVLPGRHRHRVTRHYGPRPVPPDRSVPEA